jgi:hypothetical protein
MRLALPKYIGEERRPCSNNNTNSSKNNNKYNNKYNIPTLLMAINNLPLALATNLW